MGETVDEELKTDDGRARSLALLALVGLVVGVWAFLPPYSGPALNTEQRVEIADHVVPGVVILAICGAAVLLGRRGRLSDNLSFGGGLGILLAGFWMDATHFPLVLQATRDQAPWGGAIYHSLPGLAVSILGVAWTFSYWTPPPPDEDDHTSTSTDDLAP